MLLIVINASTVKALDISDYEDAEIVVDLNGGIPAYLEGQFDFIYDGSCLDNIFDPATSLKNMTRLLKPGGRIVLLEFATHVYGAYVTYSPAWFYDYFTVNGFADCKVYLAFFRRLDDEWAIYDYNPHRSATPPRTQWANYFPEKRDFVIVTVAERGQSSTDDRSPVQDQYRRGDEIQRYIDCREGILTIGKTAAQRTPVRQGGCNWNAGRDGAARKTSEEFKAE